MKFFFGLLTFIAAVVVVILLVVSFFRSMDSQGTNNLVTSSYSLEDKAAVESIARYTVAGPVVAEENYRRVRITVSKNARTVEVIKGYKGTVDKTSTLPNTPEAYSAFLGALRAAKFSNRRDAAFADPSAICVTGNKYYYELAIVSDKKIDTWTTSCSLKDGTFAGNNEGTAQIFRSQIPDYQKITNGVSLYSL